MGKVNKSLVVSVAIFGGFAGYLVTAPEEVRWVGVPLLIGVMVAKLGWDIRKSRIGNQG